ncbi:uncharacterized protein LOC117832690 isoform X1 [Xyrichtys novacula]|uniref:Uncharacterized protein LOC117832690 isoform X1 n=1 Tax=Xyrichtys novacula TaxID=13765 RepID=A0AAV1F9B3_XYRNO|nr:uncharacterized protein LOC117832690 isoform X1 [Xyrichtys novacula]
MPRKSQKSQTASQRWQRVHDIDFVSTGQADGVPQSSGEVKRSEVSEAVKQGGENASCQPQISNADVLKRRRVSESPAADPSNTEQVNHRGEINDPGVQQVTYADMVKRKLPRVSRTAGPSNTRQVNYIAQTDEACSTQISYADTGEQNVCASRSQASLKYGRSRNQQCTCNSLTFLAFLYENENITRADLDRVLDKGDVMYREIRKTVDHAHLTTDELPNQVPARRHTQSVDMLQLSRYESPYTSTSVTTTVINDDTSAPQMNTVVCQNTEHDMETEPKPLIDFSQCSVTLTGPESLFSEMNTAVSDDSHDTSQKISTLMETQAHQPGQISNNPVTFEEAQEIQSNLTQPFITIPVASVSVIHDISSKLSKLETKKRKKYKRRQMASKKTTQGKEDKKMKEREKYAKNETYKAKKKSYSSNKYSDNPEIQTKKRQNIATKYRDSTDFRLKQKEYIKKKYRENVEFKSRQQEYIKKKYRENVEFKGRQKEYIKKKYRENVDFKGRQKEYIRKKYSEDTNFRQRQQLYMNHRYANDEIFCHQHRQLMRQMMRDSVKISKRMYLITADKQMLLQRPES